MLVLINWSAWWGIVEVACAAAPIENFLRKCNSWSWERGFLLMLACEPFGIRSLDLEDARMVPRQWPAPQPTAAIIVFQRWACVLLQCFHASPFSVTCIGMTTRSGYHILILIFFFWSDSIYLYIFKHFQLFLFLKLLNFIKNKYNLFII